MKRISISDRLRFKILERDKFKCVYCGTKPTRRELHIDHAHPVARGGSNNFENLVTSCRLCNMGKAARVIADPGLFQVDIKSSRFGHKRPRGIRKNIPVSLALPEPYREVLDWMNVHYCYDLRRLMLSAIRDKLQQIMVEQPESLRRSDYIYEPPPNVDLRTRG